MKSSAKRNGSDFWAITSYFNPMRYQRRLANYQIFRKHLNVPLVAVELAYAADAELSEGDADILVQLRGSDIMWQKERLLNVALQALPSTCRKVVWVDCDIIFESDDWSEQTSDLLDRFMMIQPFSRLHSMPHDWAPDGARPASAVLEQPSVGFAIASGVPSAVCLSQHPLERTQDAYLTGLTWAARRELLDEHGFYDACIVGGGDRAMTSAAYGCFDQVMHLHCMNERQKERYLAWAKPVYDDVRAQLGFFDCKLFHLWHGDLRNRRVLERHRDLSGLGFDPFEDIAVDNNGCWQWNTDKSQLHGYVKDYFAARKEDG